MADNQSASDQPLHFLKLYGRVSKSAASRFNATRRLNYHNHASLWTISLFSLGLIFVSLLQAMGFALPFTDKTVNLVQVFLAITILVISVILTMSNYSARAERFHACGLELNHLALRLERVEKDDGTIEDYNAYAEEYGEILKRYENHHNIDFMFMKLQKSQHYDYAWWYPVIVYLRFGGQFLPYLALLALEATWIVTLVLRTSFVSAT